MTSLIIRLLVGWALLAAAACGASERGGTSSGSVGQEGTQEVPAGQVLLRADVPTTGSVTRPDFPPDEYAAERAAMVRYQIRDRQVRDRPTLAAMERVPRHLFVDPADYFQAYADHPVPIGHGQTISQPYVVAFMTELLVLEPGDRVLEVGTGSGYQAAILAEIAREVWTVEIIDELARAAARRLESLVYKNINVLAGDGYFGWPGQGPFDAIVVTAAAEHVPPPLVAQLKPGGRMAIPVGRTGWTQNLLVVEKKEDGQVVTRNVLPVRFVPLTRKRR
jgi:protein-L-isoaspartate(D-aspartate) O-methyltransferase